MPKVPPQAYAQGAKFQSSFYGLLAQTRQPAVYTALQDRAPEQDWGVIRFARAPLFQAGFAAEALAAVDSGNGSGPFCKNS